MIIHVYPWRLYQIVINDHFPVANFPVADFPSRRPAASPCRLATGAGAGRSGLQPGAGAWKLDQGSGWVRRESQEQGIYIYIYNIYIYNHTVNE